MATVNIEVSVAEDVPAAEESARQRPYRMSYEAYERIGELGVIRREDHVVLLDGILVQSMNKGPGHSSDVIEGLFMLARIIPDGWHVRPEQPITLRHGPRGDSAPEPDLAVVLGRNGQYKQRHPEAAEVSVVVEVASSPAAFADDRSGLRRYAHAGIPTALIVALHDSSIHVFTEPSGPAAEPGYARVEVKRPGELIEIALRSLKPGEAPTILGPIAVGSFFAPVL